MKKWIPTAITLALAAVPLAAQEPHYGLGIVLGVPTGALNSAGYPDGQIEGYNSGLGVQFTVSWPVDRSLALRLNVGGVTFDGTGSATGQANWNVEDSLISVGGEAEVFLGDGSAQRHLGTYLIGGLSLDMERFSASDYDPAYFASSEVTKNRLAATVGIGHTFRSYGRYRWSMEAVYHKTLTGTDANDYSGVGFPAADFVKLYVGFGF